mmetsp:Transcript_73752/g.173221  ORF Transcript_73752/g.173221 Transcript_73752/m.173221 type:complete len:85 (-) Transcript_73752:166-420(-)
MTDTPRQTTAWKMQKDRIRLRDEIINPITWQTPSQRAMLLSFAEEHPLKQGHLAQQREQQRVQRSLNFGGSGAVCNTFSACKSD